MSATPEVLSYEWVQVAGVRLPVHLPLTLVPLRPLAAELGLRYECLVSAAGRLPEGAAIACHAIQDADQAKPRYTVCIDAENVGALGLLAQPRAVTPGLIELRKNHHVVFKAFNVPTGAEFAGRRYGSDDMLDEPKMLKIVALARAGQTPAEIGTELGKSTSVIRKFLLGLYGTTAAVAFYKKHGKPCQASRDSVRGAQEST